jgi:hypothetical protein
MVNIDEELEAAKQAQTVISKLSTSSVLNSNDVATLRNTYDVARKAMTTLSSGGPRNEARHTVGIALPDLMRGPLTQAKIDNAEGAIDVWMMELLQR